MKKILALVLAIVMITTMFAACGEPTVSQPSTSATPDASKPAETKSADPVHVKLFNMKVEIDQALQEKVKPAFEAENPGIILDIETLGGGADYNGAVMAKYQSGETPDIWNNSGWSNLDVWVTKLEDLSNEPWVADMNEGAAVPITKDGKIYGFPLATEGFGFAYNKTLFAQAGIDDIPKTYIELEDACKKLQGAGIQPFSNSYAEWWVLGMHNFNIPLTGMADSQKLIDDIAAGSLSIKDSSNFDGWVKLLQLTLTYGQKNPTTAGDYASSVGDFSSGKAAMIQQGNWIMPDINKVNPELDIGFIPMPTSDSVAEEKIHAGVPNFWSIDNSSSVKKEAKIFLNWLAASETGRKCLTDDMLCLPCFKSIKGTGFTGLNDSLIEYAAAGKTYPWAFPRLPSGASELIGDAMMKYLAGQISSDDMAATIDQAIKDRAAASAQ